MATGVKDSVFDEGLHGQSWEFNVTQDGFLVAVRTAEEELGSELVPEFFLQLRLFVELSAKP
jgi:hypothetical protein